MIDKALILLDDKNKVVIVFKAAGNAPILKRSKFKISADFTFGYVIKFVREKLLKLEPNQTLVNFTIECINKL